MTKHVKKKPCIKFSSMLLFFKVNKMNILMLGDVIAEPVVDSLCNNLPKIKKKYNIDFCVVNAENAALHGISPSIANRLNNAGADVLTMGNHTFSRADDFKAISDMGFPIIRPANYPPNSIGYGHILVEHGEITIAVINLIGRCFMDPCDCPYRTVDKLLEKIKNKAQIILVDFHAEATSEKIAMGWWLDGKVSAVCGTHTHVQTSDEKILPQGTGYITDLGMVGATNSVLGVNKDKILKYLIDRFPEKKAPGDGPVEICGIVAEIDENTGKCLQIQRIRESAIG